MDSHRAGRCGFLITMMGLGAGVLLAAGAPGARAAAAAAAKTARYNPAATFPITVTDVDFRRNQAGRMLMARVYRPTGPGPFPTVLDLHGGAWNAKDRHAGEPMDRALAASGLLVVAIDMTLAKEAPYPANVQDANYGVRWLKWKAPSWNGDPSRLGVYGSSSGGHAAELLAMRPDDPRYNRIPLPEAPTLDAKIAYAAMRSGISDTVGRYENAKKRGAKGMVENNETYFKPMETIHESNPQEILDRHERINMAPMLLMAGSLDDNVLPEFQKKFAASYKAAGGDIQFELFEGADHNWVENPGPLTDRAHEMVKAFIARQLGARGSK